MGEEQKKSEEQKPEEQKPEPNKTEEKKKEEEAKPAEEEKAQESKPDEAKAEEVAPPPPPPEIVLKVFMHCEGCARKVRRCLKGFPGVEEVITDCKSHKVVVKGEKADPLKVLERVQRKSHRKVELLSPIPKPPVEKKAQEEEEKRKPKPEEKKVEPQIVTVLKVHMHCEACAQEIKRRMQRMKGVESAEPDLKNSQVSVKGVYDPAKLVEYMYKRTGKQAVIVNQEAEKKEKVEEAAKEEKKEEKKEEEKKSGEDGVNKEKKEEEAKVDAAKEEEKEEPTSAEENKKAVPEVKINEYFYNPQRYGMELYAYPAHSAYPAHPAHSAYPPHYQAYPAQYQAYPGYYHAYPPQLFSDENPNACTVM